MDTEPVQRRERIAVHGRVGHLKMAVDAAIDTMPDAFVLRPFFTQHKLEIGTMLLTEFDAVEHDEIVFNEGKAEGIAEGIAEALRNMMREFKITFEQAAQVLQITPNEYALYQKRLEK